MPGSRNEPRWNKPGRSGMQWQSGNPLYCLLNNDRWMDGWQSGQNRMPIFRCLLLPPLPPSTHILHVLAAESVYFQDLGSAFRQSRILSELFHCIPSFSVGKIRFFSWEPFQMYCTYFQLLKECPNKCQTNFEQLEIH